MAGQEDYWNNWDSEMERRVKKRNANDEPEKKFRGDKCSPSIPLARLKNVGGAKFTRKTIQISIPFVELALRLLDEDPVHPSTNLDGIAVEIHDAPDAKIWGLHLDHLTETSAVGFPTDDKGEKIRKEETAKEKRVYCRYKGVHKDELEARAIFDLMVLNLVCSPLCVEFTLLGGRAFIAVLRSIPFREKKMRIFHADVANSYYQILIGRKLGRRINIRRGQQTLEALVLPMGFKKSCGIAQGIFWGVILFRDKDDEDLGVDGSVYEMIDAPGYVRLASGGVIILIYDSIFVIDTPSGAEKWSRRIQRNMHNANVILKYAILEKEATDPDLEKCPMYGGLRFQYSGHEGLTWTLQADSLASWKERVARPLRNTPRTFYKLLGYVRFAWGVLDIHERCLGRWSKAQSRLGSVITSWDAEIVDAKVIKAVCEVIQRIENRRRHAGSFKADVGRPLKIGYAAGDATKWCYAACLFVDGAPILPGIVVTFAEERPIEIGESLGQEACVTRLRDAGCNVGIIVGDNQGVGYAFEKGYAKNDETDVVIARTVAGAGKMAVVVMDIDTKSNYADIATARAVVAPIQKSFSE